LDGANARALGVATAWRQGGGDAQVLLTASPPPAPGLPNLPASTSFATLDRDGNAVVCAVSLNNLFGTGRIAPGTGIVLAASAAVTPPPLLSAALDYNGNVHAFHALTAGTGQAGAPVAAASTLVQALSVRGSFGEAQMSLAPEPGRVNVIGCPGYLPDDSASCGWATDPRGAGLAIGSN
jgi:gamma-glutamyltranspeptidase/glutathione hydrolase